MPQDERRPLHRRELGQGGAYGPLHLQAEGDAGGSWSGGGERRLAIAVWTVEAIEPFLVAGAVPLLLAREVQGGVDRDAVKPGSELGAGVEAVERAVGPQERLLDRILGALLVAGDAPGEAEQLRPV